jgi:hypothetical protein
MSFGFDKVKKPDPPDRNLDLSGLNMKPPVPAVEKEKKALAKGEKLGFSSRESSGAGSTQPTVASSSKDQRRFWTDL